MTQGTEMYQDREEYGRKVVFLLAMNPWTLSTNPRRRESILRMLRYVGYGMGL
jgi:hypothetical protein